MSFTQNITHRFLMFLSVSAMSLFFASPVRALDTTLTNEASWHYVTDAIGDCTDYATSIPKARQDAPFIQIRVQHTLIQSKCKFTLAIANKVTSCFVTPEQREEIQRDGKQVIAKLLDDDATCGAKAEQVLLANAPEPINIARLPAKEPVFTIAPPIEKPKTLVERLKAKLLDE